MTVTFKNPPLVELVTELRWGMPGGFAGQGSMVQLAGDSNVADEELYMHFASLASTNGYARFERLIPPGFPTIDYNSVCRFRPTDVAQQSPLFQLGSNVFTANAVPPYRSWNDFSPSVDQGLEILESAFERLGKPLPFFTEAVVRYIDAFDSSFTDGKDMMTFLSEVLGFRMELPVAITDAMTDPSRMQAGFQLSFPVNVGMMTIVVAEGTVKNRPAVILDCSISIREGIDPTRAGAMAAFTRGRAEIHKFFVSITKKLQEKMKPEAL